MKISPFAGTLAPPEALINVSQLLDAYDAQHPDPSVAAQRVRFGTSGHRGSSLDTSFNRDHILAITQAICEYRSRSHITGPLMLGRDTHALSLPAFETALEVLAAHQVTVFIATETEFTPTPVISHAILRYNQDRTGGFADGIVITPSHNPPREGGFKYNPPHGGPAQKAITGWIEGRANEILSSQLQSVRKTPFSRALRSATTHLHDFLNPYVQDLANVVDMQLIRDAQLNLGVDPMGGAGIDYWPSIAEFYGIKLSITNSQIDPSFSFVPRDWDGQIRMDPSSAYAMGGLVRQAGQYDLAFACDTDHDRHGIVTPGQGLMPANHYLAVAMNYLLLNRPTWRRDLQIGKTLVSSKIIDRVVASLGHGLYEVPVGFKWFVDGLLSEKLGFAGEESAGATFLRSNGRVWTTDKDGIVPCLLAAEMTARTGRTPALLYHDLSQKCGNPFYRRIEAAANPVQKEKLRKLDATDLALDSLAGEKVISTITRASGNDEPIGGIKIETENGWFAARPSGTEDVYKIYAESFLGLAHLEQIIEAAQTWVDAALAQVPGDA